MGKKILFVNPPVLAVVEPWFDEPKFVRTALAHLAGYLRAHCDWEIKCIDAKFNRWDFNKTLNEVLAWQPDLVALTAFTNEVKPAAYLAGLVKAASPDTLTLIGGAHFTALPEVTLAEFPSFDMGVVGEGEETLLALCSTLAAGGDLASILGLAHRDKDGRIIRNPDRHRILDQDSLPMPAWDLFPPAEEYYIQTVRGCPFTCSCCMNHNGRVARKRSVDKVIEEMRWLIEDFKAKRISFGDELFSVDMPRTIHLLDAMIREGIGNKVQWDVQTHVAYVNEEIMAKMKLAVVTRVEMGVESGDADILRKMGKGTHEEMIVSAFELAKRHGVSTGSFFIIGQPNETRESIRKTIRLAIRINPDEPIFGSMVPYPGTEVALLAAKGEAGFRLLTTNWDEYGKQVNGSLEIEGLSKAKLDRYQMIGYVSVFLANGRFADFLRFFWNYRSAALRLLGKSMLGGKRSAVTSRPADYDQVLRSPRKATVSDLAASRLAWKQLQNSEMQFAKENRPNLLKEQMPL